MHIDMLAKRTVRGRTYCTSPFRPAVYRQYRIDKPPNVLDAGGGGGRVTIDRILLPAPWAPLVISGVVSRRNMAPRSSVVG